MNILDFDFSLENLQILPESRTSGLATLFSADSRPLGMRPCSWAGLIMGISVDRGGETRVRKCSKSPRRSQASCLANHPRSPCAPRNTPPASKAAVFRSLRLPCAWNGDEETSKMGRCFSGV